MARGSSCLARTQARRRAPHVEGRGRRQARRDARQALPARYAQEGLPALAVAQRPAALLAALVGLLGCLLGAAQAVLEVGGVERVGRQRLLDEDEHALGADLDVALALRVALDVGLRSV